MPPPETGAAGPWEARLLAALTADEGAATAAADRWQRVGTGLQDIADRLVGEAGGQLSTSWRGVASEEALRAFSELSELVAARGTAMTEVSSALTAAAGALGRARGAVAALPPVPPVPTMPGPPTTASGPVDLARPTSVGGADPARSAYDAAVTARATAINAREDAARLAFEQLETELGTARQRVVDASQVTGQSYSAPSVPTTGGGTTTPAPGGPRPGSGAGDDGPDPVLTSQGPSSTANGQGLTGGELTGSGSSALGGPSGPDLLPIPAGATAVLTATGPDAVAPPVPA